MGKIFEFSTEKIISCTAMPKKRTARGKIRMEIPMEPWKVYALKAWGKRNNYNFPQAVDFFIECMLNKYGYSIIQNWDPNIKDVPMD
jgi:hypothetical protein